MNSLLVSNSLFSFTFVKNYGAAFNIFDGAKTFLILFSLIALIVIIIFTVKNIKKLSMINIFSIALLCAGIFCNMSERLELGYVRDFIKLNFIDFPVFNISDIYINISVFIILLSVVKNTYFKKNEHNSR
jgi:signal peptidase II